MLVGRNNRLATMGVMVAACAILAGSHRADARSDKPTSPEPQPVVGPHRAARYDGHKVVRAHVESQQQLDALFALGAMP